MIELREFLLRARLDAGVLDAFVEAGWLVRREGFTELDVARACLIRDLREAMGVNDEGVGVVLDLVDQLHGVRAALRGLALALHTLPTPLREQALAALRAADGGEAE